MSGVYVVIGAKGGTGRELVHRLAERSADEVSEIRALVRDPSTLPAGALPDDPRVKLMAGDCSDAASMATHATGAEGIFFAASGKGWKLAQAVDRDGVGLVANAAKAAGVRRVLLVSSQLVHPDNRWNPIRGILNTVVTGPFHKEGLMDFKYAGENLLRSSGQEYTICRPGQLTDGSLGNGQICVAQSNASFRTGGGSTRADVAAACVVAMMPGAVGAVNTTFEMDCDKPKKDGSAAEPPTDALFESLESRWGQ